MADFIHYQDSLLHVDFGGMNLPYIDMEYLFYRGLAKSRTLRSCHLIGVANYGPKKFRELLKLINVRDHDKHDFCSRYDKDKLSRIFEK